MIDAEVQGVDAAAGDVARWVGGLGSDLAPAFDQIGTRVISRTRSTLPRRTGALAGSLTSTREGVGVTVAMGSGLRYGGYVEFGGRGFPHSAVGNYLGAAAQAVTPQVAGLLSQQTTNSIERFPWSKS